jgi:CubicO group peptidase (beta-lactamase class C family)
MRLRTITLALLTLALLALSMPATASAQARTAADYVAAIEGVQSTPGPNGLGRLTVTELMARFNVPGISIAVIRDHQIHLAKGYGTADVETGAQVNTETMFQAASISKPVAAMGVLRAVQDGLFTLDDDINMIITSWKLNNDEFTKDRAVTPRMLASHSSGLGDGFGFPGYDPSGPVPTVVQILEGHESSNVGVLFMERPPMTLMEYSGGGVTLMQQALSDARKRPFADIMRDDVLRPIGMNNSTFEQPLPPALDRNAARAHSREGTSMGAKWHVYPEQAAAGLWTTPSDLARLVIEVQRSAAGQSNRVLSRTHVQEMLSPVGVGDYAVGFSIAKIGQGWYFAHGGANWGFRATLLAHKSNGYGLVIMTNADQGGAVAAELSRRIQMAYEWDSFAEPAPRGYRPPVAPVGMTSSAAQQDAVNAIFADYASSGSPGCAVSVTRDGSTLFQRAYGLADIEQDVPITPQSAFYAASVSKQFTAAAIGLLVLRGQLSLDANVRDLVPEVPDYGTPITVRHLLHHTSGLRDYLSLSAISGAPEDAPLTESDFLATISRQRGLNFAPGTRYSYSNTGYVLLSLIVRQASGLSLREYATREIFMPLGMANTVFRDSHTTLIPRRATAYDTIDGGFRTRVPGFDLVGDGGLFTTAEDLAKWNPAALDRALDVPGLSALMVERGRLDSGETIDYAMGLNIGTYRGAPIVRHGGSYGGYRAAYAVVPSASTTVALLCNIRSAAPFAMTNRILDVYLGDRLAENAPATPAAVPASTAARSPISNPGFETRELLGDYFSAELDARWTIQPGATDGIALRRQNLAPMALSVIDTAQLHFTISDTPLALRFERDGSGHVTGFIADIDEISGIRFEKLR